MRFTKLGHACVRLEKDGAVLRSSRGRASRSTTRCSAIRAWPASPTGWRWPGNRSAHGSSAWSRAAPSSS